MSADMTHCRGVRKEGPQRGAEKLPNSPEIVGR